MNLARNIGYHLCDLLNKNNISIEKFSEDMGFEFNDMHLILEGRKIVPPHILKKFATYFNVAPNYFLNPHNDTNIPELYFLKIFSNEENLNIILDIIDVYADLMESI